MNNCNLVFGLEILMPGIFLGLKFQAVIGQFYGPNSTVRPAKFESSPDAISFVYQNLLQ